MSSTWTRHSRPLLQIRAEALSKNLENWLTESLRLPVDGFTRPATHVLPHALWLEAGDRPSSISVGASTVSASFGRLSASVQLAKGRWRGGRGRLRKGACTTAIGQEWSVGEVAVGA